jgi:hypothetical protein
MIRQFVVVHLWGKKSFIIKGYLRIIMEWKVKLHLPNVFRLRQLQVARLMILQLLGKWLVCWKVCCVSKVTNRFMLFLLRAQPSKALHCSFSSLKTKSLFSLVKKLNYDNWDRFVLFWFLKMLSLCFFVENLHCM